MRSGSYLTYWNTHLVSCDRKRLIEGLFLVSITFAVGQVIFLGWLEKYVGITPKGYLMFFFVSWAAIRLDRRWVILMLLMIAIQALTGACNTVGFFAHDIAGAFLVNYILYMLILSVVGMSITAYISQIRRHELEIHHLAFYDPLTQLPNRRLLNDRLFMVYAASKRNNCYAALMLLDLDKFKPLNDSHGHLAGDILLVEVANRLKGCVREGDTVARYGGDEFVILISELNKDKTLSTTQAKIIAEKILISMAEPYRIEIKVKDKIEKVIEHHCSSSIGVVLFINQNGIMDEMIKRADMAMYEAKRAGGNLIRFYDSFD